MAVKVDWLLLQIIIKDDFQAVSTVIFCGTSCIFDFRWNFWVLFYQREVSLPALLFLP